MSELTQARLKELLHYDPLNGLFTMLIRTSKRFKVGDVAGHMVASGYISISIYGKIYRAHRLAFLYMEGYFPPNEVDHIDHVRDNNTWINLRHATRTENLRNQSRAKRNTSGNTGVYW